MGEPVTLWQRVPLNDGSERVVALSEDGKTIHVARLTAGSELATAEISFELKDAIDLATACLAGNARAQTMPGLARVLCASLLVLSVAAFKAGAIKPLMSADDGCFSDRSEA